MSGILSVMNNNFNLTQSGNEIKLTTRRQKYKGTDTDMRLIGLYFSPHQI